MIRIILGILLIICAIPLGLYVGVWLCFILGIVQVIDSVKATPVESLGVAVGIARIMGAAVIGFFSSVIMFIPGIGMIISVDKYSGSTSSFRKRKR
jgi:hypothetical protein